MALAKTLRVTKWAMARATRAIVTNAVDAVAFILAFAAVAAVFIAAAATTILQCRCPQHSHCSGCCHHPSLQHSNQTAMAWASGGQAIATMAMVTATKRAMVMTTRWRAAKRVMATVARVMKMATKRAMVSVARVMATVTERATSIDGEGNGVGGKSNSDGSEEGNSKGGKSNGYGNKEGNGDGGKIDGDSNKEGNGKGGQWQGREEVRRWRLWWRATKRAMARAATGNGYGKEGGGRSMAATMGAAQRTRPLALQMERGG
jgi:hypothetical protein